MRNKVCMWPQYQHIQVKTMNDLLACTCESIQFYAKKDYRSYRHSPLTTYLCFKSNRAVMANDSNQIKWKFSHNILWTEGRTEETNQDTIFPSTGNKSLKTQNSLTNKSPLVFIFVDVVESLCVCVCFSVPKYQQFLFITQHTPHSAHREREKRTR